MNRPDHGAILLPFIGGALAWAAHSILAAMAVLAVLLCLHLATNLLERRRVLSWKSSDNMRMIGFLGICALAILS